MRIRAGDLNRRIKIRIPNFTRDNAGGIVNTNFDEFEVSAKYIPLTGKESVVGDQVAALIDAEFWIRYRSDIGAGHEVEMDGRIFDIYNANPINLREGLRIQATERRQKQ